MRSSEAGTSSFFVIVIMSVTVKELSKQIGAELLGDGLVLVESVGPVEEATERQVTFISGEKHKRALKRSGAGALITAERIAGWERPQLVVKDVNVALIETMKFFAPKLKSPAGGVDATAVVGKNVVLGKDVSVGACAVIADDVQIGDGSVVGAGCYIGENSRIGQGCRLDCGVVVYHNCVLGNCVILQANSVIGGTGFGYVFIEGAHRLIPHNGGVVIEDYVEIGASSCVDRAKFGNTVVGAGTKIDNLCQIAHNVQIGKCCLIAGQTGIAGSTKLGDGVVLGGHSGVSDNVTLGDGVRAGAHTIILSDAEAGAVLLGCPAADSRKVMRNYGYVSRLEKLFNQVRGLSSRVERLEASEDDKEHGKTGG